MLCGIWHCLSISLFEWVFLDVVCSVYTTFDLFYHLYIIYMYFERKSEAVCIFCETWQCTCICIFPIWTSVKMVCMCHFVQCLYPHVPEFLKKIEACCCCCYTCCLEFHVLSLFELFYIVCNVYHYCFFKFSIQILHEYRCLENVGVCMLCETINGLSVFFLWFICNAVCYVYFIFCSCVWCV